MGVNLNVASLGISIWMWRHYGHHYELWRSFRVSRCRSNAIRYFSPLSYTTSVVTTFQTSSQMIDSWLSEEVLAKPCFYHTDGIRFSEKWWIIGNITHDLSCLLSHVCFLCLLTSWYSFISSSGVYSEGHSSCLMLKRGAETALS